jgi:RNA polymerase sigma-70 factor (ECF subfamily)
VEIVSTINNDYISELDVKLAKKGDKDAFSRLIEFNKVSMYRVALSMVKKKEDIEDAIQNSIIKAYQDVIYLRKDEYFKTWLIRILINECKSILKNNSKLVHIEEINSDIEIAQDFSNVEIICAINLLEDDLRTVTTLFYFEDMPQKEIAKVLDIPEGTVKSRLSRARNMLYELLRLK